MSENLIKLVTEYSKGSITKNFINHKYNSIMMDLMELYLNDKNSSTLRQIITCEVIGIKSNPNKLGYDGYESKDEIKPKNIGSDSKKKLDAGGNYTDLTFKRHNKYIEDNPNIHVSGFIDGLLMYVLKIPYNNLQNHFYSKLVKKFPNGDVTGSYLRSATFNFNNLKLCPELTIEFVRNDLDNYTKFFQKDLFNYLKNNSI
jgi:hypothetical protein